MHKCFMSPLLIPILSDDTNDDRCFKIGLSYIENDTLKNENENDFNKFFQNRTIQNRKFSRSDPFELFKNKTQKTDQSNILIGDYKYYWSDEVLKGTNITIYEVFLYILLAIFLGVTVSLIFAE